MILLLAVCLVVMLVSIFMVLNALQQMETLRQQNTVFQSELTQLQKAHQELLTHLYPPEPPPKAQLEAEAEAKAAVQAEARHEASASIRADLERAQKLLEKHYLKLHYYPDSVSTLIQFAEQQQVTPSRHNPYTGLHAPLFHNDTFLDITHEPVDEGLAEFAGRLLYQAHLEPEGRGMGYTLAAFDDEGMLLKDDAGEVLTLEHLPAYEASEDALKTSL